MTKNGSGNLTPSSAEDSRATRKIMAPTLDRVKDSLGEAGAMEKLSRVWLVAAGLIAAAVAGWLAYRAYEARRITRETGRLAAELGLEPTSRVADVGAGSGAYSLELAARIVTKGHVFATEIHETALERIRRAAAHTPLSGRNIRPMMPAIRSQLSASPRSCFRPALVIE